MPELVLAGNKLSAQAKIKMLQHNIKHQCLRGVEAKNSEIKFKTSLLQTNVKGQWRSEEIQSCGVLPAVATIHQTTYCPEGMRRVRNGKILLSFSY